MGSGNLGKVIGMVLIIPLSFIIGAWVLTNPSGAISGLSKVLTFAVAFVALTNPKMGLMLLVPQALYTDEIKRLAVSFGAVSYSTVYEVLLGPLITISCLNLGFFASIIFGRSTITRNWILFYGLICVLSIVIFATAEGSIPTRAQLVLNTGLYLTIIPIMVSFLKDGKDVRKFLLSQVWWAVPSALWGIQQYYFGLSAMEVDYARTGLSATHYGEVLLRRDPRPFGFFGSNSGFSSVGIFMILAILYLRVQKEKKVFHLILAIIYVCAVFASRQRTILLLAPLVFMTAWAFRSRFLTRAYYASVVIVFVLAVANAGMLMTTGIEKVNAAIASNSNWGRDVLTVGTFSDRLRGWTRLTKSSTYSVFGTQDRGFNYGGKVDLTADSYNHDIINKILIHTGVAGMLLTIGIAWLVMSRIHGLVYAIKDERTKKEASVLLATAFMVVLLSFTAGSILSTNPINLLIWSIAGTFLIISQRAVKEEVNEKEAAEPAVRANFASRLPRPAAQATG